MAIWFQVSGFRCQVSGMMNTGTKSNFVSLYLGLNPRLFEPFLKEYLIVIQAILTGYFIF